MKLASRVEAYARKYEPLARALDNAIKLTRDGYGEALWRSLPSDQRREKRGFDHDVSRAYEEIRKGEMSNAMRWYARASEAGYEGLLGSWRLRTLSTVIDKESSGRIERLLSAGQMDEVYHSFLGWQETAAKTGVRAERLEGMARTIVQSYFGLVVGRFRQDEILARFDYVSGEEVAQKSLLSPKELQMMKENLIRGLAIIGMEQIGSGDYFAAGKAFNFALRVAQPLGMGSVAMLELSRSFADAYVLKGQSHGLELPIGCIIGLEHMLGKGFEGAKAGLERLNAITSAVVEDSAREAALKDSEKSRKIN